MTAPDVADLLAGMDPAHLAQAEAIADEMASISGEVARTSRERFDAMFPAVVARLAGEGAVHEALASGGFALEGRTVVVRLHQENDHIEYFCDVGLPEPHALQETYRTLLEMNLCRAYPGITFGVHPDSGRVVATLAVHDVLVAGEEACIATVQMLVQVVGLLVEARTLALVPE